MWESLPKLLQGKLYNGLVSYRRRGEQEEAFYYESRESERNQILERERNGTFLYASLEHVKYTLASVKELTDVAADHMKPLAWLVA